MPSETTRSGPQVPLVSPPSTGSGRRGAAAPGPAVPGPRTAVAPRRTLAAALLGGFLIVLDASAVNVALPAMGRDLHGGMSALQWVVDGYTLAFASLMLSTGALADRIGAGRAFAGGVAVFTAASCGCGLAPGLHVLVAARVLQGVAASLIMPSSLALVRRAHPDPADRARAISLWAAGSGVAVAAGPVAGGVLTTAWSWRALFFVNLPLGLVTLLLLAGTARSPRRPAPLDVPGQLTAAVALAGLTFAVIERGRAGLVALVVAAAAAAVCCAVEARHPHPLLPPGLFRVPAVTVPLAAGCAFNFAFYGTVFLFSLFFQQLCGRSALAAGLMFVPMAGLISAVNVLSGRVTNRYGPRPPMLVGQSLMLAGMLVLLPVGTGTPAWLVAVAMVPLGLGGALAVPALTATAMGAVPAERAGLAAGVLNSGRQISAALGVAVSGALVADRTRFVHGMRVGLLLAAVPVAAALAATAAGLRAGRPEA